MRGLRPTVPSVCMFREEKDKWVPDAKLDGHTDWVRDVAWAPSIGLPVSRIASCSQDCKVVIWKKDEVERGPWKPQVCTYGTVIKKN